MSVLFDGWQIDKSTIQCTHVGSECTKKADAYMHESVEACDKSKADHNAAIDAKIADVTALDETLFTVKYKEQETARLTALKY